MVKVNRLTYLTFELNSLIDLGYSVSLGDAKKICEEKTLFDELERRFPIKDTGFDLSILDESDRKEISDEFWDMSLAVNEKRKFGIENKGLCLLIAYSQEMIQRTIRNKYDPYVEIRKSKK